MCTDIVVMDEIDKYINNFASRSFRDIADCDYINARICYRAHLVSQFHWSALQAIEKYYKAILLYNRIKAPKIGHSLSEAQRHTKQLPFTIKLSETSTKLIEHLDPYGRFRYLDSSYFIKGPVLVELDKAVWELRRYCRVINYNVILSDGSEPINMLEHKLEDIESAEENPRNYYKLRQGKLEEIIKNETHHARASLIWQNGYYGNTELKDVSIPTYTYAENAPLSIYPDMLDKLVEYIKIPSEVVKAYREKSNGQLLDQISGCVGRLQMKNILLKACSSFVHLYLRNY